MLLKLPETIKRKAADDTIIIGDKVEYVATMLGQDGFQQGTVAKIEGGNALINIAGDPNMQEQVPVSQLAKIEEFSAELEAAPEDYKRMEEESMMEPIAAANDARNMVIEAMGYKDLNGQLRACCLLGMAQDKMWKSAAQQVKKKLEKEMKERVKALTKWGTVKPSQAAVLDVIEKVLMENGITAYPNLVRAIFANPFAEMTGYQTRGNGPDTGGNEMSEAR
jgi:hypothetical protein